MSGPFRVCFVGGARYARPLDATSAKKFRALEPLGDLRVIGFVQRMWPARFQQHATFYLLPEWPLALVRYAEMLTLGTLLVFWCIARHGSRILVAQSPYEGLAAELARTLARMFGMRAALAVESHGDFEESPFLYRKVRAEGWQRRIMQWSARFVLKRADALRAVSRGTREQLERWAPGKPIVQFATWTDLEVFLAAGGSANLQRPPIILYAGVIVPLKGIRELVQAFARVVREFPSARLRVTGRIQDTEYFRETARLAEETCPAGSVEFCEAVPQEELARQMTEASVFVLPSFSEGLPRVVFEAMATGTPAIGSRAGGIPELIEDGVTGWLVPPGDVDALAEKILWSLRHPSEARAMGEKARQFAREVMTPEKYVEGYRQLFETASRAVEDR
jgi:glycosyltransferase involved in cell wall biosynthesis